MNIILTGAKCSIELFLYKCATQEKIIVAMELAKKIDQLTIHHSQLTQLFLNGVIISKAGMFASNISFVCRFSIWYVPYMRPISV